MSDMRSLIEKLTAIAEDRPTIGDGVYLEFGNILEVDTEIMEMSNDSITLLGDEKLFKFLESLDETEDKHGSPYDRGRADSYYGRSYNPHKLVPNAHGGHEYEKLTNSSEIEAYSKGYREETGRKDYGESVHEADYYGRAVTPTSRFRTASAFTQDTEKAATKYKPNKYDPVTGLGGYISSHAQSNEKYNKNIVNQIKRNLDSAIGRPLEFENGDTLQINPVIAKKALAKIENLKPVARHDAINSIMRSKANFIGFMGESVEEGEVVSLQNNPQTLKRLAKMWWNGSQDQHAQAAKMIDNMGYDIDEDDDDVVLTKGDEEIRFFMDDLYEEMVSEAEYHGRKVQLNKPHRGDVKKFAVFVKDPKSGNVKKVNFGDPNMRIKKSNPKRRKSFRARHNCANPGPRTKARYWSCRKW
jgi:hypothetical protein